MTTEKHLTLAIARVVWRDGDIKVAPTDYSATTQNCGIGPVLSLGAHRRAASATRATCSVAEIARSGEGPYQALRRAGTSSGSTATDCRYASRAAATSWAASLGATFRNSGMNWSHCTRIRRARGLAVFSSCSRIRRLEHLDVRVVQLLDLDHVVVDPALEGARLVHARTPRRWTSRRRSSGPRGPARRRCRRSCTRSSDCPRPRSRRWRR